MFVINQDRKKTLDDGVWASYKGAEFLISHTSNMKFQRTLARLQAPHRKQIEKGNLDPSESKAIVCQALAEGILNGWKNVGDENGTPIEYTKKLAQAALMNDEELREFVQEFSTDLANFREQEIGDKGNV